MAGKVVYVCVCVFSVQTVAKFGGLDILVSNAAVNPSFGPTTTVSFSLLYGMYVFIVSGIITTITTHHV